MEEFTLGEPEKPKKKFPVKTAAGAAAVIIILAGVGVWYFRFREVVRQDASGRAVATAQPGQVISGFPSSLLLEKGVNIESSYRVDAAGGSQPTATYMSNMSLADNLKAFKNYFDTNNWQIVTYADKITPSYIYAVTKGYAQEANVVFSTVGGKIQVMISVLNHPAPAQTNGPAF